VKSGFAAIAGRPNVGKSTLVNALCGGKVAIVSDKPQTTRRRIFGIANGDDYQLVLADLPGFQRPLDAHSRGVFAYSEFPANVMEASFFEIPQQNGVAIVVPEFVHRFIQDGAKLRPCRTGIRLTKNFIH
jgi:GTP-binding protein Era